MSSSSGRLKSSFLGLGLLAVVVGGAYVGYRFLNPKGGDVIDTAEVAPAPLEDGKPPKLEPSKGVADGKPEKGAGPTSFSVTCIRTDGVQVPLAGLQVMAAPMRGTQEHRELAVFQVTDAAGMAQFDDMPYARYVVEARPEGMYPLQARDVSSGTITLIYGKTAPLSGTAIGSDTQAPLNGVKVKVYSKLEGDVIAQRYQQALLTKQDLQSIEGADVQTPSYFEEIVTDETGRFECAVPVGYRVNFKLEHPDYDPLESNLFSRDGEGSTDQRYVLIRRTEIYGKVLDSITEEPIAGVLVQAGEGGIPPDVFVSFGLEPKVIECVSADDGSYRLTNVARGRQYLLVEQEGYYKYEEFFEIGELEPTEKNIPLNRGATISGRVLDGAGRPVEGATVYWMLPEELLFAQDYSFKDGVETGPDGAFSYADVPPEKPFHVLAVHPNYMEGRNENVVVQPGENLTGIEVFLVSGGSITGFVQTSSREPIARAVITARPVNRPGPPLPAVESQADGTFRIPNTRNGLYELTCESPGYCPGTAGSVRESATGVAFYLSKEAVYSGTVVDGDRDKPVTKFRLRAKPSDAPTERKLVSETFRSEDGAFELRGLFPGEWDFEFSAEEMAPRVLTGLHFGEGEVVADQEIVLNQGASATGSVTCNDHAVEGALVRFEFLESFSQSDKTYLDLQTRAGDDGIYEMRNLLPGRYKAWASHPRYAQPQPLEVTIQDGPPTTVDILLERPAKLRLLVRNESGGVVGGARAMLFQGKSPIDSAERVVGAGGVGVKVENPVSRSGIMSLSDAAAHATGFNTPVPESGEVVWHRKEPGEWTLWVTASGYYRYQKKLTLLPGKELIHEAVLEQIAEGADPKKPPKPDRKKNEDQEGSAAGTLPGVPDGGNSRR